MNKVILIGRLTKDPELRATQNGKSVATFTIAVNREIKAEGQPDADFLSVVVWGASADNCGKYLTKGSQVGVDGRIQVRSYDDKNGNKAYITEIVANRVEFINRNTNEAENGVKSTQEEFITGKEPVTEEEIPF